MVFALARALHLHMGLFFFGHWTANFATRPLLPNPTSFSPLALRLASLPNTIGLVMQAAKSRHACNGSFYHASFHAMSVHL